MTLYSFSQEKTKISDKTSIYKNSVKGSVFPFLITGPIVSVSLGYERTLSKHSIIELGTYYLFAYDDMGVEHHYIGIMPAYKYYTVSKNKLLNDIWISAYLSYLRDTHIYHLEDNFRERIDYYGIGGTIGKRINLNKNKRTFLDIGFGISQNLYNDKPTVSNNDWSNTFRYRPIIQIGRKF
jgi:hypothetical protein